MQSSDDVPEARARRQSHSGATFFLLVASAMLTLEATACETDQLQWRVEWHEQ